MSEVLEIIWTVAAGVVVPVVLVVLLVIWLAVRIPAEYFLAMSNMIDSELSGSVMAEESHIGRLVRVNQHADQSRAFPQYFFGQVQIDAKNVIDNFERGVRRVIADRWAVAAEMLESSNSYLKTAFGISIRIGIVIGAACGVMISVVIGIIHLIVAIVCAIFAALVSVILRSVDTAIRLAAGARMVCPVCAQAARPYAIYKCPSCGELHRDVRSGRRGIVVRICRCGQRMPTLLLTGAKRLTAICPRCMSPLPPGFGRTSEVMIPFIGSVRAGKTQLIYTLVLALKALASNSKGTFTLIGESQQEFDRIGKQLSLTGSPGPTIPDSPEALVLHLALGAKKRYFYLFDPAGELHYRDAGLDELRYLGKVHTLVYVADPLAAPSVWDRLDEKQKQELASMRSDWAEAELAYELSRERIRRMGGKKRQMRLAFVVTKCDALSDLPILTDEESVRRLVEDPDWMDMGNIVREAMQSFDKVKFFAAAAMRDESGLPDTSIEELAEWLTGVEGFGIGRH